MADILQENVIKLSTQIDNSGISQILGALTKVKNSSIGVTAAVAGLTTAVYKFIESTVKEELSLKRLATQQRKALETTRAEQQALKSMGMTLQEINKDKNLKKTYKDLVEFNKELKLPNMSETMDKINKLREAFWKFKSVINYTVKSIGLQLLKNLEQPIKRITDKMGEITKWFKTNMNWISRDVARYLTAFSKGIIGIGEGIGKVLKFVNSLPAGIKAAVAAIGALWAIIKSGPIGMIISAITLIGDLIHDYENFKWNRDNPDKTPVGTLNDLFKDKDSHGLWEVFESEGFSGFGRMFLEKIAESLEGVDASALGESFAGVIAKIFETLTAAITGNEQGGMFGALATVGHTFAKKIFEFISSAITSIQQSEVKTDVQNIITGIFGKITGGISAAITLVIGQKGESGEYENGLIQYGAQLVRSILGFIGEGAKTLSDSEIGTELATFINEMFTKLGNFLSQGTDDIVKIIPDALNVALELGKGVANFIAQALGGIDTDAINNFAVSLWDALKKAIKELGDRLGKEGEGGIDLTGIFNDIGTKIGNAIGDLITIGTNFLTTFLGEAINWISDPKNIEQLADIGRRILSAILSGLGNIWDAIMKKLFGNNWVGTGERRETVSGVAGKFVDPETGEHLTETEGRSGETWTETGAMDYTAENPRAAQVEFGLRDADQSEVYKQAFYGALGNEGLSRGLGYSKNFANDILGMFGFGYDPDRGYYNKNDNSQQIDAEKSAELFEALNSLNAADSIESFQESFETLSGIMSELGAEDLDIGSAFEEAQKAALDFATKAEQAANRVGKVNPGGGNDGNSTPATTTPSGPINTDIKNTASATTNANQGLNSTGQAGTQAASSLATLKNASSTVYTAFSTLVQKINSLNISPKQAWGGRIGSEGTYTVGEDGAEYIIPITKTERAISLIKQMLSEMGTSAVNKVANEFGFGNSGSVGSGIGAAVSAMQGMVMNTTYNISAPVTITVTASGGDSKEIGMAAYSAAERHLVKTLRGVYS